MPMIEATLSKAGVAFDDLDRIAVTTGPGSFTGVRVGVAAARGLALALDIPAVGIGSLEALASPLVRTARNGTVVAALDAKRGEVFAIYSERRLRRSSGRSHIRFPCCGLRDTSPAVSNDHSSLVGTGAPLVASR